MSDAAWARRVGEVLSALGPDVVVDERHDPVAVDVPRSRWVEAVTLARDGLSCTYFDWLSAVDELDDGFRMVVHLVDRRPGRLRHLVVRTLLPREAPTVASLTGVFAGAAWHERETHEMFGVQVSDDGRPCAVEPLLLPAGFEGHPLRKDFVLASRVASDWPGEVEPGGGRARRPLRAPGVPEPDQWGPRAPGSPTPDPLAPARPGRVRRTRPAGEGRDG